MTSSHGFTHSHSSVRVTKPENLSLSLYKSDIQLCGLAFVTLMLSLCMLLSVNLTRTTAPIQSASTQLPNSTKDLSLL